MVLSSSNFDNILEGYKKDLVGREFVYLSKYGSTTFGKVARVHLGVSAAFDNETNRRFMVSLSRVSPKVTVGESDLSPIEVEREWSGSFPSITIISENNISYNLESDKIYFLQNESERINFEKKS